VIMFATISATSALASAGSLAQSTVSAASTTAMQVNTAFDPVLMEPSIWQVIWFLLIGVLLIGYFVLDGFDLGSGALYPFIAKDEKEKSWVRRSIGPFWDGNEVWLLTAGGGLLAAFGPAYAATFSGFYLAIMLVLFGLIARATAVEFRSHGNTLPRFFDGAFFIGSALPALLFGVAIGNVLQGVPLSADGFYAGMPLVGLLGVFPLTCGLVSLSVMLLQGAAWQALKLPIGSAIRERAIKLRRVFLIVVPLAFVVSSVAYFVCCAPELGAVSLKEVLRFVGIAVIILGVFAGFVFHGYAANNPKQGEAAVKKQDVGSFVSISLIPVGLIVLTAASLYPYLVPSLGPGPSISVASAGGSDTALTAMTIIACIGLPLVLVYHVILYRTFRGRLTDEDTY